MEQESPAQYIRHVMEDEGLSFRDVAERAARLGHSLSVSYVHLLFKGQVINPTIGSLRALAAGLSRSESEVFSVFGVDTDVLSAEVIVESPRFAAMSDMYERLTFEKREQIDSQINELEAKLKDLSQ